MKAAIEGLVETDSITDLGNLQEVRWAGDPHRLLETLMPRTRITHFEVTRPSLHDIFVRIASPEPEQEPAAASLS